MITYLATYQIVCIYLTLSSARQRWGGAGVSMCIGVGVGGGGGGGGEGERQVLHILRHYSCTRQRNACADEW